MSDPRTMETGAVLRARLLTQLADYREDTTRPASDCSLCGDTGYVYVTEARKNEALGSFKGCGVRRCECRRKRIIDAKTAAIPERFRNAVFDSTVAMDHKQSQAQIQMASDFTQSYFLWGAYGRGKTYLATAQYRKLIEIEKPCMFFTVIELMEEFRKAEMEWDYFCEVRQRVRNESEFHLFIDDFDKFKSNEFRGNALLDLINTLHRRKLGLTVTTNYNLSELEQRGIDGAIIRRLDDICKVIEV